MRSETGNLAKRITFCGIFSSLALTVLLAGTLLSLAVYLCPVIAGCLLLPVVEEYRLRSGWLCYLCVSLIGLLILPDKEALLLFIALLGYYPLIKPAMDKIRPVPIRIVCKLALFNATVLGAYWCMLHLFRLQALMQELAEYTSFLLTVLILLANLTFLLYDLAIARLLLLYRRVLLPRVRKSLK